jgi:hypothetical protein
MDIPSASQQAKKSKDAASVMGLHSVVTPFIGALLSCLVAQFVDTAGLWLFIFPLSLVWGMIVAVVALCCGERWRGLAGIGLLLNATLLFGLVWILNHFLSGWGC